MSRIPVRVTLLLAAILAAVTAPALADVEVNKVDWETIGPNVRFHVQFHNPDTANPSEPVSGQMHSQPYGAFVPNSGLIGDFNIPPIAPDSFFDVFFEVELSQLPPSGETITPGGGAGGILSLSEAQAPCPPPTFWNGNVDIFWDGPGGSGTVNYHFGQLQICPGSDPSYIHVILGCDDPAGIFWSFGPGCPGWTVSLVENAGFGPGGPASVYPQVRPCLREPRAVWIST